MRRAAALVAVMLVAAGTAAAHAPDSSLRPVSRPDAEAGEAMVPMAAALPPPAAEPADGRMQGRLSGPDLPDLRPLVRPGSIRLPVQPIPLAPTSDDIAANTAGVRMVLSTSGVVRSPRPFLRPLEIVQEAMAQRRLKRQGAVCGDIEIQGETLGNFPGRGACGIKGAVRVRSVAGVDLTQQATIDCGTALALKRWVTGAVKPSIGSRGGGLARLKVAAHYSCRTRNNQRGAKLSEHGKGRAIDISGFILRNGTTLTVLRDWTGPDSHILQGMHRRACDFFGTVLGPRADRFHQDHFHLDTARYRSGSYCR